VVGPSSAQTSWSLNGAARGRTIVSSACAGGQYPPFAAASFDLFDQFNISAPTTYNVTFITSVSVGQGNAPLAGSSQLNPFLPNSAPGNDYIFPGGSGFWYDPPAAYGYTFTMIGSSNFTQILNFPVGIDTDGLFVVRTGGQSIGTFSVGQKVDFVALTGAAVSSFQVLGIEPLVDGDDQVAFPIQLAFDSPTATFTMSPINMIPTSPFCFGDGTGGACPCGNSGAPGHGCENSHTTGGAILTASGISSLADDSLVLSSSGELPMALSIPTQGQTMISPLFFGDGLRCVGGSLKRLYVKHAVGGVATAPEAGDISISARSAAAGDTITVGATRYYYTFYRDASPTFCPDPPGNTWNVSSSLAVVWGL
jgi:hypothetical protein